MRHGVHITSSQAAFFTAGSIKPYESYMWMGVMSLLVAQLAWLVYFPMWGGMVCPAKADVTEQVLPPPTPDVTVPKLLWRNHLSGIDRLLRNSTLSTFL